VGFGGPVVLMGYMHRDLVEQLKWISEDKYREGLALAQLAPARLRPSLPFTWVTCTTVPLVQGW